MENYVVLAFAYGAPHDIPSNQKIGERAVEIAKRWQIPIFTQYDVPIPGDFSLNVFFIDKSGGTTHRIIKKFAKVAKERKWKYVCLVAAPPHKARCDRDLRKYGFNVVIEPFETTEAQRRWYANNWYDRKSSQLCTRSPIFWWPREMFLRLLPWYLYEKLTG